jgi:hypothetical protein
VARDVAHRLQNALVLDAARRDLPRDHLLACAKGIHDFSL